MARQLTELEEMDMPCNQAACLALDGLADVECCTALQYCVDLYHENLSS